MREGLLYSGIAARATRHDLQCSMSTKDNYYDNA